VISARAAAVALVWLGCAPEVELARVRGDASVTPGLDQGPPADVIALPDLSADDTFDAGTLDVTASDIPTFDATEDVALDVAVDVVGADLPPDARFDASGWSPVGSGTFSDLRAVWGSGPNDVWVVGDGGAVLRWDGARWRSVQSNTFASLRAIWGDSPTNVWAVGTAFSDVPVVIRWNGTSWRTVSFVQSRRYPLRGVWGERADAVRVVGGSFENPAGPVYRWDGAAWREERLADRDVLSLGIHGRAGMGPWVVGDNGSAFRRDAAAWMELASLPRGVTFTGGVWIWSAEDVWATGARGALHHYAMGRWTTSMLRTTEQFNALWGDAPMSMWSVGRRGAIARWNGADWTVVQASTQDLWSVWGAGPNDVWAVGDNGTILRKVR
jgi:hypothetical protein